MRVAMLSAAPVNSHGWGRYTRELVQALAPLGVEITLITAADAPVQSDLPLAAYHRVLPSLVPAKRLSSLRLLALGPVVSRLIRGCDGVHVVAEPYALAVPFARRLVVTAHGTYVPITATRPVVGWLYRQVYRRSTIVCVSTYTEQQVRTVLPNARTVVIPNGVDVARYQQAGIPPDKRGPTVLAVGQLKSRKGYHILVQALREIRDVVPNIRAVFIGDTSDGSYTASLRAQIEAEGLAETVQILGRVPDETLLGWYHAADVFALPSINVGGKFEGFGLVYLEANAAGLPAVGTLGCGADDAIRDGETGYLVPQNDPTAVAQAVIKLLINAELRTQMSAAGAAFAAENSWDLVARRVLDCYRRYADPIP